MSLAGLKKIKPADLPSPPQAAMQIMQACSRKRVNNDELATITALDPLLTAELLRIANSSLFSHGSSVTSIQRAIQLLGQRALRNLALCLAVRDALAGSAIPGLDLSLFWEDAIRRAVIARLLAQRLKLDTEEAFTAGLLQDFGLLVLFQLQPERGVHFSELRLLHPEQRRQRELQLFAASHDQVVALLATAWKLPKALAGALAGHHQRGSQPDSGRLAQILQGADWLASLFSAEDTAFVAKQCTGLLVTQYRFKPEQVEPFLDTIPAQTSEAAEALGLGVGPQADVSELLRAANLKLAADNVSYQELNWRLQKVIRQRDELATELRQELQLAREVQQSLLPLPVPQLPALGVNLPARQLSGDFYDFFPLADGRMAFNLGDVSGKGSHAALLMAKTSALFRCLAKQQADPGALLTVINNELAESAVRGMFVTMIAGIFAPETGRLWLANAGHPPALQFDSQGQLQAQLGAQGPPLGIVGGCAFTSQELEIGDNSLYIYSDGVLDGSLDGKNNMDLDGLLSYLHKQGDTPPQQVVEGLVARLQKFPQQDDITMLIIGHHCCQNGEGHGR